VTFGLLMARAGGIKLSDGFAKVAERLTPTSTLIGAALRLLTDSAENQAALKTSLGNTDARPRCRSLANDQQRESGDLVVFYEDFLEVYDSHLRKLTGSYYNASGRG